MLGSIFAKARPQGSVCAKFVMSACAAVLVGVSVPAHAQEMETFDPNAVFDTATPSDVQGSLQAEADNVAAEVGVVDADVVGSAYRTAPSLDSSAEPTAQPGFTDEVNDWGDAVQTDNWGTDVPVAAVQPVPQWENPSPDPVVTNASDEAATYGQDDLIGAAEGVFGKGAKGLAGLIEDLLRKQGEPNGYIVGREAGGAFIFGARYGSGTLHHRVEGERKVYWTGPSLGLDAGANAGNTFVLVYNLFDSEDIFKRYPAGEGQAYLVGGMHASYMRRGDVVLIPIRVGAGLRLGVNAGYMRFSKKHRWLPF